eukprot:TRINITY_DN1206_c0_g1_i1.p1 TRINITY_DN1206_c0_g1~~TRINITY_DN1206_c0_g1_i1.p1  ORF type:complete len:816 (-),score=180.49 TRINITY_DN1206_c0_g1_i1:129-2576(-)
MPGLREFKSCLYVLSKRYKQEVINTLFGVLRCLSDNNAPMMSALKKLRDKRILSLSEKVALETGFYSLFRKVIETTTIIKDSAVKANKIVSGVFEYSKEIFMSILELISRIQPHTPIINMLELPEAYKEWDFVCPFSMKQIENAVEIRLDNGQRQICEERSITDLLKDKKEIPGVKDSTKLAPLSTNPLSIMKVIYYCMESPICTYWLGNHDYNLAELKAQLAPYPLVQDLDKLSTMAESNEYFRIYNSLTIKYYGNFPCLIQDTANLYGVAEQIMECGTTNVYYDVTTGDTITIKVVSEAVAKKQVEEIKDEVVITEAPEEVIAVLFDVSGSMQEEYVEKLEKMRAAKSFFFTFADRAMGYNLKSAISLILFNNEITVKCQFTERFRSFKRHVEKSTPNNSTRMYDALIFAADNLGKFGSEYPSALRRIIIFTDGEDTGSAKTKLDATKVLRAKNVLVDSVVVGTKNQEIKAISFSTGGCSYFFSGLEEGIQLFENETFLKATLRVKKIIPDVHSMDQLNKLQSLPYDNSPPEMVANHLFEVKVADPSKAIAAPMAPPTTVSSSTSAPGSTGCMKRIMKEMTSLSQNPQPNFYFFPSEKDSSLWKLIQIGPTGCPYEGYTWILTMQFPSDYPFKPPKIRYITPIYHCNISKTGTICHSVLSHNWSPAITIKEIFIHLNNMLIEPNIDDQIENSVAQDYYVDRALYYKNLDASCKKNSNFTLEQRLEEMGMKLESIVLHHPQDYLDPHSKQMMIDPVVSSVSGYTFDRTSIIEYIKKEGKDPINNLPLTEAQLSPNEALKATVKKYMASIYGKAS